MKLLRVLSALTALTLPTLLAAPSGLGDADSGAAQQFRAALSARVQEMSKRGASATAGLDHWLFLVSELRFLSCETFWGPAAAKVSRSPKPEAADPLPAIVDFQQQLKARGVDLLLVPVPPKAAIYPEKLLAGAPLDDSAAGAPLQRFYQELAANGVDVLDLSPLFAAQRAGADALYCKTDTHWSGAGCVLAAHAIAERVRAKLAGTGAPETFSSAWTDVEIDGDLSGLLPAEVEKPGKEKVRLRQVTNQTTNAGVEADQANPLLILGDSHTLVFHDFAAAHSGLLDQLALELGAAPDLIGVRGSGATAVRINLLRRTIKDPEYLAKKKVVVWVFTAREFTESEQGWAKIMLKGAK